MASGPDHTILSFAAAAAQKKAKRIIDEFAAQHDAESRHVGDLIFALAAVPGQFDAGLVSSIQSLLVPHATVDNVKLAMKSQVFVPVGDEADSRYEFTEGAREVLLNSLPITYIHFVFYTAAAILTDRFPDGMVTFYALTQGAFDHVTIDETTIAAARLSLEIWRRTPEHYLQPSTPLPLLEKQLAAYDEVQAQRK